MSWSINIPFEAASFLTLSVSASSSFVLIAFALFSIGGLIFSDFSNSYTFSKMSLGKSVSDLYANSINCFAKKLSI